MKRGILRTLALIFACVAFIMIIPATYIIVWLDRKLKFPLPFPRDVAQLAGSGGAQVDCAHQPDKKKEGPS